MTDLKQRLAEETLEFAAREIDSALAALIPRGVTDDELVAFFRGRLEEMRDEYQDFLSLPDV